MTQSPQNMTDILDLKDMTPLDLSWIWIVLIALAVLLAVGLAFLFYSLWKKRSAASSKVILSPLQIALQKLDELTRSGLLESAQIRRFYFGLSELYREFIEKELKLMACETTLEELRPQLKSSPELSAEDVHDALWLLELGDMAKFAKLEPPPEEIARSIQLTRAWITRVAEAQAAKLKQPALQAAGGAA